ncbi:MAG: rod shape-determining protein MreC [bacterium]
MRLPHGFIPLLISLGITIALSILDITHIVNLRDPFIELKIPIQRAGIMIRQLSGQIERTREIAGFQHEIIAEKKPQAMLENENRELKCLLSLTLILPYEYKTATVLDRVYVNDRVMELIIDKGSDDGISEGTAVISGYGLVGKVSEVSKKTSTISVLGNPSLKVSVILPKTDEVGVLSADKEGSIYIDYLSAYSDVSIGDPVWTSGDGGIFPRGVLVGRVLDVKPTTSEPFIKCSVLLSTDMKVVSFVSLCER